MRYYSVYPKLIGTFLPEEESPEPDDLSTAIALKHPLFEGTSQERLGAEQEELGRTLRRSCGGCLDSVADHGKSCEAEVSNRDGAEHEALPGQDCRPTARRAMAKQVSSRRAVDMSLAAPLRWRRKVIKSRSA